MASRSIYEYYSREEVEEMKQHLRDHPIDPQYDEECELMLDGNPPIGQLLSRTDYEILADFGELPDDIPKWEGINLIHRYGIDKYE